MQIFSLATLALGLLASTASAQTKIKVMLLGDSITQITCWRPKVWSQLASAGLTSSIEFVGSQTDIPGSCGSLPAGFDRRHEGHSGFQAYDIARNNIAGWVRTSKPDVLQFMLGTNDVNIGKRNAQAILDSYTAILNAARAANPKVNVIVCPCPCVLTLPLRIRDMLLTWNVPVSQIDKMIPTRWSDATIEAVNTAIPNWASQHSTAASPITVADCSRAAGYTNAMLQGDGVHPNGQGDDFIAKQVGPKLIQAINAVRGG